VNQTSCVHPPPCPESATLTLSKVHLGAPRAKKGRKCLAFSLFALVCWLGRGIRRPLNLGLTTCGGRLVYAYFSSFFFFSFWACLLACPRIKSVFGPLMTHEVICVTYRGLSAPSISSSFIARGQKIFGSGPGPILSIFFGFSHCFVEAHLQIGYDQGVQSWFKNCTITLRSFLAFQTCLQHDASFVKRV
jgi:hypothetical protein